MAYVPVLHRGYIQLFEKVNANEVWVVDQDILNSFDYIRKDLRALTPVQVVGILTQTKVANKIGLLCKKDIKKLDMATNHIVMPNDDVSHYIATRLKCATHEFYPVFLRWDRRSVDSVSKTDPDEAVTSAKLHREFMQVAADASVRSTDIWRRVGAVIVTKDEKTVLTATNQGEPTPFSPWIEGDPRNIFNRGVAIEMSVFAHAEAALVAEAAKRGLKLEGAKMYSTTFPCPACAKVIAHSGIKTCYYSEGYSVLDGKRELEAYGVKAVRVIDELADTTHPDSWVPYKK